MAKKFTPLQTAALKDLIQFGELSRNTAHDRFTPGSHAGQTIASLYDKGLIDVIDWSYYGYPLKIMLNEKTPSSDEL